MELPQYTLRPNTNRMVTPWILKLLGLAALFYGGIYFNVRFAFGKEIPVYINLFIFAFLIVLIVTQLILYHVKFGKYKYMFYTDRIDYEGKKPTTFLFSDFQAAELKQGLFDRFFNTGAIRMSKNFVIGPVSNVAQVKSYLEQLVKYFRYSQERYKAQQQQMAAQKEMAAQGTAGTAPGGAPAPVAGVAR